MNKALIVTTILLGINGLNSFSQNIFTDSGQRHGNLSSWDVKLGDLDNDGDLDAVVANWEPGILERNEIWLNNGSGSYQKSSIELGSSQEVILFDIDNDNDLDIYQGLPSNIYINDNMSFNLSGNYIFKGTFIHFAKDLINSDRSYAFTIESMTDSTLLRRYTLDNNKAELADSMIIQNFRLLTFNGGGIKSGDLNGDGYLDLILYQYGPTFILLNDKNGGYAVGSQKLGNYKTGGIKIGDLNNDGYMDIIQTNYGLSTDSHIAGPVKCYLNDKSGFFNKVDLPLDSTRMCSHASIIDLDKDGDADVFINYGDPGSGNLQTNKCVMLMNNGSALFTSTTIDILPIGPSIAFGDIDNDGDTDAFLAITNFYAANSGAPNRVWFNNSATTSINQITKEELKIYPNPTSNNINIKTENSLSKYNYRIYNANGNKIEQGILTQNTIIINHLPSGVYFLSLLNGNKELKSERFVVE